MDTVDSDSEYSLDEEGETCVNCGELPCSTVTYSEELRLTFEGCQSERLTRESKNEKMSPDQARFYSYTEFVRIVYGALGKGNRVQLSPCIEKCIRDEFPNDNGEYVGFKEKEDPYKDHLM